MLNKIRAESGVSLLMAILLFSILLISYSQWQSKQLKRENYLYQEIQELSIAENQIARKMADLACESHITQNKMNFEIQCSDKMIKVRFLMGEIQIGE